MKRWSSWIASVLIFALLVGCTDAGSFAKGHYPLVNVEGTGQQMSKIYSAEGKDVPTVAKELSNEEKPKETSKTSTDQMFLIYQDKMINLQKDPKDDKNTLVEINTIEYAKQHYGSSFLEGYLTATVLQSIMGGSWFQNHRSYDYRGYTSTPSYKSSGSTFSPSNSGIDKNSPSTSDRNGSFSSGKSGSATTDTDGSIRKNDGSTPRVPSGTSSKPNTSSRSGSFSKKK